MTARSRSTGTFSTKQHVTQLYQTARFGGCSNPMTRQLYGNLTYSEVVGFRKIMSDTVVPGFRKRVANGEVIMNRMSMREMEILPAEYSGFTSYYVGAYQCSGSSKFRTINEIGPESTLWSTPGANFTPVNDLWSIPQLIGSNTVESLIAEASTRCHAERGSYEVTLWETIAERKQAYAMLSQYVEQAKKISKSLLTEINTRDRKFYQKNIRNFSRLTAGAAGAWLITRYGLLPLMNDIRALIKQLKEDVDENTRHTTRAKAEFATSSSSSTIVPYDTGISENRTTVLGDTVIVRAMSIDEWKLSIADHFGLGYKDLVVLPYQLISLSFVGDWFVNASDFLKAMVPTPGVNQLGSCVVIERFQSITHLNQGIVAYGDGEVISASTMSKTGKTREKTRIPGLRAPTLIRLNRSKIDPDQYKNHMRVVDALALVGQRLAAGATHLSRMDLSKYSE